VKGSFVGIDALAFEIGHNMLASLQQHDNSAYAGFYYHFKQLFCYLGFLKR